MKVKFDRRSRADVVLHRSRHGFLSSPILLFLPPASVFMSLLISCETGGDRWMPGLPPPDELSDSVDRPARDAAELLASCLDADLLVNEFSSELIDVSRSVRHRGLYSSRTKGLPEAIKRELVDGIHVPYRRRMASRIAAILVDHQFCIHLSVRTFPAKSKGVYRRGDVGLGYDTNRRCEVETCLDWIDDMYDHLIMLKVRRNFPRRGNADSLTRTMRSEFPESRYLGIEVQLNRAWVGRDVAVREEVLRGMAESFDYIVHDMRRLPAISDQRPSKAEAA